MRHVNSPGRAKKPRISVSLTPILHERLLAHVDPEVDRSASNVIAEAIKHYLDHRERVSQIEEEAAQYAARSNGPLGHAKPHLSMKTPKKTG